MHWCYEARLLRLGMSNSAVLLLPGGDILDYGSDQAFFWGHSLGWLVHSRPRGPPSTYPGSPNHGAAAVLAVAHSTAGMFNAMPGPGRYSPRGAPWPGLPWRLARGSEGGRLRPGRRAGAR